MDADRLSIRIHQDNQSGMRIAFPDRQNDKTLGVCVVSEYRYRSCFYGSDVAPIEKIAAAWKSKVTNSSRSFNYCRYCFYLCFGVLDQAHRRNHSYSKPLRQKWCLFNIELYKSRFKVLLGKSWQMAVQNFAPERYSTIRKFLFGLTAGRFILLSKSCELSISSHSKLELLFLCKTRQT